MNNKGIIIEMNDRITMLLGYTRDELVGTSLGTLVEGSYRHAHGENVAKFFSSPKFRDLHNNLDIKVRKKSGTMIPCMVGLAPIKVNEEVAVVAFIRDRSLKMQAKHNLDLLEYIIERLKDKIG